MKKLLIILIKIYKLFISPILPKACRFIPTCSDYMIDSIKVHGAVRGVSKGIIRLLKCHPFNNKD